MKRIQTLNEKSKLIHPILLKIILKTHSPNTPEITVKGQPQNEKSKFMHPKLLKIIFKTHSPHTPEITVKDLHQPKTGTLDRRSLKSLKQNLEFLRKTI